MPENVLHVSVRTHPAYEVQIGAGLMQCCGSVLRELLSTKKLLIVTDTNVAPLYLEKVRRSLENSGFLVSSYIFPYGESNKNFNTLCRLLEYMATERMTRSDCVVALGGGVTGDMAGFASAIYMRGIRYVQFPTTLLAAVDSSVGGKTAVDLEAGKNLAGAFAQPAAVLCDTDCFHTLPPKVFSDGIAEAVKTGVLKGEELFSLFENEILSSHSDKRITGIIAQCVAYKAMIVARDEREQNERRFLNLGHTIGHAIEKCSAYRISHGYAVAAGLGIISRIAECQGWAKQPLSKRIQTCLARNGLPYGTDFSAEVLAETVLSDKKRSGGDITLVIPAQIGHCVLKTVPITELLPMLRLVLSS